MDKIKQVSIGSISFTIDDAAHILLENYLNTLESHYSTQPNGTEIIEGIEERMSELFFERVGQFGIITTSIASDVVEIMGMPSEIDVDQVSDKDVSANIRKKLFRDTSDKWLAGICSGFAAYISSDPKRLTRLLRAILLFIFVACIFIGVLRFINVPAVLVPVITYILLWIIIPPAKSTEEKCQMRGFRLDADGIRMDVEQGKLNNQNYNLSESVIYKLSKLIIGVVLIFVGVMFLLALTGVLSSVSIVAGIVGFLFEFTLIEKILLLFACSIPSVYFLYQGVILTFKLKSPKWKPGLIMVIIWMVTLVGLIPFAVNDIYDFANSRNQYAKEKLTDLGDTIYVEYVGLDKYNKDMVTIWAERNEFKLICEENDGVKKALVHYPLVERNSFGALKDSTIVSSMMLFPHNVTLENLDSAQEMDFYEFQNDTLRLFPFRYETSADLYRFTPTVELNLPKNVKVLVVEPIEYELSYSNQLKYTNANRGMRILNKILD